MELVSRDIQTGRKSGAWLIEYHLPAIQQPDMKFTLDNFSTRQTSIIENWFYENDIPLVDWSPYSPDLNPTENAWGKL